MGTRSSIGNVKDTSIKIKSFLHKCWHVICGKQCLRVWNDSLTSHHLVEHGFYPSDWYSLATPGEQVADAVIDDIINNVIRGGVRRASIQLFEENEGVLKLVWRKCIRQVEQLCLLYVVANSVEVLFGHNPSYCVFDQSCMSQTGMNIIRQRRLVRFPKARERLLVNKNGLMLCTISICHNFTTLYF